jgi:hypothetical protein
MGRISVFVIVVRLSCPQIEFRHTSVSECAQSKLQPQSSDTSVVQRLIGKMAATHVISKVELHCFEQPLRRTRGEPGLVQIVQGLSAVVQWSPVCKRLFIHLAGLK